MNLQIVSPYKKCPYACPFCVAGYTDENPFSDSIYYKDPFFYFSNLRRVLYEYDIDTVVLTGDTEPTLFPEWIEQVIVNVPAYINIELQTNNKKYTNSQLDVISYSWAKLPKTLISPNSGAKITRDVIILSENINLFALINFKLMNQTHQMTVKQMVKNSFGNEEINKYIDETFRAYDSNIQKLLKESGIWYDENCAESSGRYFIYRCDGKMYRAWSDTKPLV